MHTYQLGEFTALFLKHQGLEDFSLAFEPKRRGARRAKRSTASIEAENPNTESPLSHSKTVRQLVEKFHHLAPQTRDWLDASSSYVVRLYDTQGEIVAFEDVLRDVRRRDDDRREAGRVKASKVIKRALRGCDQLLIEPKVIKALVIEVLKEHYPA